MMEKLGQAKTHLELKKMITEVDTTNSGLFLLFCCRIQIFNSAIHGLSVVVRFRSYSVQAIDPQQHLEREFLPDSISFPDSSENGQG